MPTTFNVISLGVLADIDTTEGDTTSENASSLVGMTFGSAGNALVNNFVSMSQVGDPGSYYDMDNNPNDQFSIDGGAAQTFDGTAVYNATITYIDGTTATYTAVLFQDINGNTYLSPEYAAGADQTALEAGAIRSISLDSLAGNTYSGMTASRETWNYVTCFVRGTMIDAADGPVLVEHLKAGDLVRTVDHGLQPLCWTGHTSVPASGNLAPIVIQKGVLGNTETLRVSPQHKILISGWRAELFFGEPEILTSAKSLVNGDTITRAVGGTVDYFHIMFDQHELVYSEGIQTESFNPGKLGMDSLTNASRDEILGLFPELRRQRDGNYFELVRPSVKAHDAPLLFS